MSDSKVMEEIKAAIEEARLAQFAAHISQTQAAQKHLIDVIESAIAEARREAFEEAAQSCDHWQSMATLGGSMAPGGKTRTAEVLSDAYQMAAKHFRTLALPRAPHQGGGENV